jgi:ABC-type branched-subunit amino acid transport system substrate-binding protein
MKVLGNSVHKGANSYFMYSNDNELLKNKKIKFIAYDDKYEPEITYENVKKLIKENIFLFFGFVGSPTVKNILPIVNEMNIPFIAPFTGATFLRNEKNENVVNFRSSYHEEIGLIIDYLYKEKNVKKFAIFYQNDDYGESGYISAINILNKYNLEIVANGSYKRNTLSIRQAFNQINAAKPEAVIMIGAYKPNSLFIELSQQSEFLKDTIFCNISFGDANEIIKELKYNVDNIIFSQVVPYYNNETIPIVEEYKNIFKKYYPKEDYGFASLESFMAAKTVVSTLAQIEGELSRSKFLQKIKNLPSNQLNGIYTKFKNMQLYNKVYLFKYEDNKFKSIKYEN